MRSVLLFKLAVMRSLLSMGMFPWEHLLDFALLPWFGVRWLIAWLWMQVWGCWRVLKHRGEGWPYPVWAWQWGRHESPEPVWCRYCLWAGARRWVVHDYTPDGFDDVEPADVCPRCGGDIDG